MLEVASANSKYIYPCTVVSSTAKKYQYLIHSEKILDEDQITDFIHEQIEDDLAGANEWIVFIDSPIHAKNSIFQDWLKAHSKKVGT